MSLEETLLTLETGFWEASAVRNGEWYEAHVTEDALFVFPGIEPVDKAQCVEAITAAVSAWESYDITDPRVVWLTDASAVITYFVTALKEDSIHPFVAQVSSTYVNRDGEWQLAFHQQTPSEEEDLSGEISGTASAMA